MQLVVLQLQIVAVLEDTRVPFGRLAGLVESVGAETSRDFTRQTSRQNNEALVALLEDLLVDARLVVEAFFVSGAEQAAEVAIACRILRKQDEMEVTTVFEIVALGDLSAIGAFARREISLASDDR